MQIDVFSKPLRNTILRLRNSHQFKKFIEWFYNRKSVLQMNFIVKFIKIFR